MNETITIQLNGAAMTVRPGTTITTLLGELHIDPKRIAVERNRAVIRRNDHAVTGLEEGDEIEIVTFVGGG